MIPMTITLTSGHIFTILSGIVGMVTLTFQAAYYLGRLAGRLEKVEVDVAAAHHAIRELKEGI